MKVCGYKQSKQVRWHLEMNSGEWDESMAGEGTWAMRTRDVNLTGLEMRPWKPIGVVEMGQQKKEQGEGPGPGYTAGYRRASSEGGRSEERGTTMCQPFTITSTAFLSWGVEPKFLPQPS